MTKISQLPLDNSPTETDYISLVDIETGLTKRTLLSVLKSLFLPAPTTDANGWKVQNIGGRKMYTRKFTWTGSTPLTQDNSIAIGGPPLPVGISTRSQAVITYSARCTDRTFLVNERIQENGTSFNFEVNQWHSAQITLTYVYIDLIAWEL